MNSYQIMGFLLFFNFAVSLISAVSVFDMSVSPDPAYDVQSYEDSTSETSKTKALNSFYGTVAVGLISGIILGGVFYSLANVPGDSAFGYSVFSTTYWAFAGNALNIFYSMTNAIPEPGSTVVGYFVVIFAVVLSLSFLSFILQMVKGPWTTFA